MLDSSTAVLHGRHASTAMKGAPIPTQPTPGIRADHGGKDGRQPAGVPGYSDAGIVQRPLRGQRGQPYGVVTPVRALGWAVRRDHCSSR